MFSTVTIAEFPLLLDGCTTHWCTLTDRAEDATPTCQLRIKRPFVRTPEVRVPTIFQIPFRSIHSEVMGPNVEDYEGHTLFRGRIQWLNVLWHT